MIIGFDDMPTYNEPANKSFYPPIQSPYHDLIWSEGWSYVPPPSDQFLPQSGNQLGIFIVNGSANVHSQNYTGPIPSNADVNGMFGAGPNYAQSAFWFDIQSLYVGCSVAADHSCLLEARGWQYDATTDQSVTGVEQLFMLHQPANDAYLTEIILEGQFSGLTAFQIVATDAETGTPVDYYVDSIALAWTNNTCAAMALRGEFV